jgi:hypothetical protein
LKKSCGQIAEGADYWNISDESKRQKITSPLVVLPLLFVKDDGGSVHSLSSQLRIVAEGPSCEKFLEKVQPSTIDKSPLHSKPLPGLAGVNEC